eukprot:6181697-Pleurochrysis_carterae.AAC.1
MQKRPQVRTIFHRHVWHSGQGRVALANCGQLMQFLCSKSRATTMQQRFGAPKVLIVPTDPNLLRPTQPHHQAVSNAFLARIIPPSCRWASPPPSPLLRLELRPESPPARTSKCTRRDCKRRRQIVSNNSENYTWSKCVGWIIGEDEVYAISKRVHRGGSCLGM